MIFFKNIFLSILWVLIDTLSIWFLMNSIVHDKNRIFMKSLITSILCLGMGAFLFLVFDPLTGGMIWYASCAMVINKFFGIGWKGGIFTSLVVFVGINAVFKFLFMGLGILSPVDVLPLSSEEYWKKADIGIVISEMWCWEPDKIVIKNNLHHKIYITTMNICGKSISIERNLSSEQEYEIVNIDIVNIPGISSEEDKEYSCRVGFVYTDTEHNGTDVVFNGEMPLEGKCRIDISKFIAVKNQSNLNI